MVGGMKAPDFSLPDQEGRVHTLADYKGKWVVLYAYPKDDTPGCTTEACNFRDNIGTLTEKGIVVLGISKDSTSSHKKFAEKFSLPFPLLADTDHTTLEAYNAWQPKKFMGKEYLGIVRKTFLINPAGEIIKTYEKMDLSNHAQEILSDVAKLG